MSNSNIPAGYNDDGEYTAGLYRHVYTDEDIIDTEPFEKKAVLSSHPLFNTPSQLRK
jgi:hypothetical protein